MAGRYMHCPTCKGEVSTEAAACPKCGHAFKSPGGLNLRDPVHVIGLLLLPVVFLLFFLFFN